MVTTTLAVVALAGALSTGASPSPSWQTDYAQAMAVASAERKPIAVFIGQGANKPGKVVADGTLPDTAAQILRDSYVCLYLDTDTGSGKELASQFQISEGLVISSPGGNVQALRHTGTVSGAELNRQLERFAAAGHPTTTVTTGVNSVIVGGTASAVVVAGNCANGRCSLNLSTSYPTATYPAGTYVTQPASGQIINGTVVYPAGYSANPFGSSCPNGRCPNVR